MHEYLRAIGFHKIRSRQSLEVLMRDTILHSDQKMIYHSADGRLLGEFSRQYAPRAGLTVCGEYDSGDQFHPEYAYPFFRGESISFCEELNIERNAGQDSFSAACEDPRVGITLIFTLLNVGEYHLVGGKDYWQRGGFPTELSALASDGTILLPMKRSRESERSRKKAIANRKKLINAARGGDEEAIESLTMEEMDLYTKVSQRAEREDILTIVESYVMPYGLECDRYSILGTIRNYVTVRNSITGEKLWEMEVECNDIVMGVCINQKDLVGEPAIGRRFKGNVWMQGFVHF